MLDRLETLIRERQSKTPAGSYTAALFAKGPNKIAQKFGEEAIEVLIAAQSQTQERLIEESADLMYHMTVLLVEHGVSWEDVWTALEQRAR